MSKLTEILTKIRRKWMKIRLQPIRVFCLHHVCATFNAESMNECDWMQIDEFKKRIICMHNSGVKFISLSEAYGKITNDKLRKAQYAVLTFDDGYASLKEILPWLEEQRIPVALFINGKYLDGKSYRKNPKEKYLTEKELFAITSPFIEIGSHGWEHTDASQMSEVEFAESIDKNIRLLSIHLRYVPFHAYTWGQHTGESNKYLLFKDIVPVYIDGQLNYNAPNVIHRQLL